MSIRRCQNGKTGGLQWSRLEQNGPAPHLLAETHCLLGVGGGVDRVGDLDNGESHEADENGVVAKVDVSVRGIPGIHGVHLLSERVQGVMKANLCNYKMMT